MEMPRRHGEFEPIPKSKEELESQVREVDSTLVDQHISPASEGEIIFNMAPEQIKERYPRRYEIYLGLLRDQKRDTSALPEEELERMSKWLYVLNSLDKYISEHHQSEKEDQTLREKQLNVFEDTRDFLEQGGKEGYIKLPTGTGKTVIFSEFVESLGLRTLIVVPKKILVEQTRKTLGEFTEDLDVGRLYSDAEEHGRQVTIITYQSLVSRIKRGDINPDDYDLLILDEVHKALSYYRSHAVKQFENAIKIGFTATHKFSEKKQVSDLLGTEIHNISIREAVEEGMLCSYYSMFVETGTDISQVPVMTTGDYNPEELEKAINISSRNKAAVEIYQKLFKGEKGIAYCQGVQHATDLAKTFSEAGIRADVIHGQHSIKEQMDLKRRFESGELQVLCNSDILIEGFDEPTASVCLNLRPTLSPVVAEQRGGRVLRLDPKNPRKHATIVDFIDKTTDRKKIQTSFVEVSGGSFVSNRKDVRLPSKEVGELSSSVKVINEPKEVLEYAHKMVEKRKDIAPMGWMNISGIAYLERVKPTVVAYVAGQYREAHPEWFQNFIGGEGKYREFFSPDLVEVIRETVKAKEKVPQGWKTTQELSYELRRIVKSISKAANMLGTGHPEWYKKFFSPSGEEAEYYSPDLVKKVRDYFSGRVA